MKNNFDTKKTQDKYSNFLKNKKIIIVGPSPHIIKSNQGEFINSYNIVVRINRGFRLHNFQKHIGNRTDILYTAFHPTTLILEKESYYLINKIKWLCLSYCNKWKRVKNFKKITNNQIPIHIVNPEIKKNIKIKWEKNILKNINYLANIMHYNISKWAEQDEKKLSSGLAAIIDLLNYDIKKLYVTGFTFYKKNPKIKENYYKEYCPDPYHTTATRGNHIHPDLEFEYFKELIKKDNRIKCDKTLKKLLKK